MRELYQSPRFKRTLKKFNSNEKAVIKEVLEEIMASPEKGDEKKGDLSRVHTRSFRLHGSPYRLSYRFDEKRIEL
ncbi:MAG: type II toxin-antitoxin system RelE/ParE family toxin, partial [Thermodesulfobacteriota bacterium]|nr:type II toxin-antitoxin system RelE/ParE family toxin [Thermodesulfobacteriota bacterium]